MVLRKVPRQYRAGTDVAVPPNSHLTDDLGPKANERVWFNHWRFFFLIIPCSGGVQLPVNQLAKNTTTRTNIRSLADKPANDTIVTDGSVVANLCSIEQVAVCAYRNVHFNDRPILYDAAFVDLTSLSNHHMTADVAVCSNGGWPP